MVVTVVVILVTLSVCSSVTVLPPVLQCYHQCPLCDSERRAGPEGGMGSLGWSCAVPLTPHCSPLSLTGSQADMRARQTLSLL